MTSCYSKDGSFEKKSSRILAILKFKEFTWQRNYWGGGGDEEKRKLCEKNDFEKKKKKPGLKFNPNRLPNSWALSTSILTLRWTTVSDKNSSDTLTKRCFFPSRAPLVPLKVVYRGSVTKSCTPTRFGAIFFREKRKRFHG